MARLSANLAVQTSDSECRLVSAAIESLDALPDDPATRPDRVGIRLILSLAAQALTAIQRN